MKNKPDQTIDPIFNVIYPPSSAVVNQLTTIRAIIPSTIKMYESTEDIHTIQPNLDMIQRAIDYLRGAPMRDELKPLPEDILKPTYIPATTGLSITSVLNRDGEYDVTIVGTDVEPKITHKELFGDLDIPVIELGIEIPITCGKNYLVTQTNPVLENYETDESITYYEDSNTWVKEKVYTMDEDFFQYAFLLQAGRTKVRIAIFGDHEEPIVFNITSHIHFKEQEIEDEEEPDTPPIIEEPDLTEGEENDGAER